MPPRPYLLKEANHDQLQADPPNVAVLPWGATEAHNRHLPYGTDVIEAELLAEQAAAAAYARGAKPIVLPVIPFGNNAQQLDQVATIHLSTTTALALLRDVAYSLKRQGIDRLVILNSHGGNEFRPLVRDVQLELGLLIVVVDFWKMLPEQRDVIFEKPGDHAGALETAMLLHLTPELVEMEQAGDGRSVAFDLRTLRQAGVWTPRPWSATQPDTGSGDPGEATQAQGKAYVAAIVEALAAMLVELSKAEPGQVPYLPQARERL